MLYGLGVTIGAGIYVLIGEAAGRAGDHAPAAFVLSAIVMGFTAGSFGELSGRVPRAAAEAVYVETAFGRPWLTRATGLAVLAEAVVAAAAISLGCAGYLGEVLPLPQPVLVTGIVLSMAAIAGLGVRQSVGVAGAMTVVEVAGLAIIVAAGFAREPDLLTHLPQALPPLGDAVAMEGVAAASLIAFFAFIGFDDIVNLVEETREPRRALPRAIWITLALVTAIYVMVALVAVRAVPLEELAGAEAPVALLFERLTGLSPLAITGIAILATANGIVIILIMAARVIYGMARAERLPAALGRVWPVTHTPVRATALVAAVVLALALFVPLGVLAEVTSRIILAVFALVNLSLVALKLSGVPAPEQAARVPLAVPVLGALGCVAMLVGTAIVG